MIGMITLIKHALLSYKAAEWLGGFLYRFHIILPRVRVNFVLTYLLLFRVNFFCSCMFSLKNRPKHFIRSLYHYLFHAYFQYNGLK